MITQLGPIDDSLKKELLAHFHKSPKPDTMEMRYDIDTDWGRYKIYKKEMWIEFLKEKLNDLVPKNWHIVGGLGYQTLYPMQIGADGCSKYSRTTDNHKAVLEKLGKADRKDARFNPAIGLYQKPKPGIDSQTIFIPLLVTGENVKMYVLKQKNWSSGAVKVNTKLKGDEVSFFSHDVVDYNERLTNECNHIKKSVFYKLVKGDNCDVIEGGAFMFNGEHLHVTNNWSKTCTSLTMLKVFITKSGVTGADLFRAANCLDANVV